MALGISFPNSKQRCGRKKYNNIYIVKGGVANTGFVVGDKEVAAIDAEMTADSAQKMIDEIRKVTSKPLTRLILTHSDGDHVNGLAGFPKGIEIISSAQAKNEMAEAFKAPNFQALQEFLPTKTFADKLDFEIAPERIQLLYFGPRTQQRRRGVFPPGSWPSSEISYSSGAIP
jgi:glyoxylase-like metal-dependent hydrolase (beta-lactamase superfamily II)